MYRPLSFALAIALALVAAACGGGGETAPTPGSLTAGPGATAQPIEAEAVSFQAEDGVVLKGHLFGTGPRGVILAHMRPADQRSWFDFARVLAGQNFTALTFDFRGYGETGGSKDYGHIDRDLRAAVRFMKARGHQTVYLVGASMGGTAALVVAAKEEVAGVVALSAPDRFEGLDARGAVGEITVPKLFLAARGDEAAATSLATLYEQAADPRDRETYEGNDHGTNLLTGREGEKVAARIVAFLRQGTP